MNLVSLVASTRSGSVNRALYHIVAPRLCARGHMLSELDYTIVEALPLYTAEAERDPGIPAEVQAMAGAIAEADGLVVATPEYNFSMPGSLKNALDWISRIKPYATIGKTVLLMSASGSPLGGWRGLSALRVPLGCLGAVALPWDITAGPVRSADQVAALAETEAFGQRIELALDQLHPG